MSNTFDKLSVLDSFIEEVNSYLPEIEANLGRLVHIPDDTEALEETYRRVHTIGGSASMMDFPGLAHVAHGMEDILGDALDGIMTLDEPALGLLQRSLGRLHQLLEGIRSGIDEEAVIAEDDADYSRYRALIEAPDQSDQSMQPTSPHFAVFPAQVATQNNGLPALPGEETAQEQYSFSAPAQSFDMPAPMHSMPSAMPSFDEVLASFRTPVVESGEEVSWPEEPVAGTQAAASSTLSPDISTLPTPSYASALDTLVASTRQVPAIEPPVSSSALIENESPSHPSGDLSLPQSNVPMPVVPQDAELAAQVASFSQAYENTQNGAQNLEVQTSSLKNLIAQLRASASLIVAQRGEFKGFLDGSKDALDRMEDWAGQAMGLNLRNSPEQVRRYLPLSVMWVSNTKLKKVRERVTFERRGDSGALRAEIEASVRQELRQEYEARPLSVAARAELERQIRNEVRQEFEANRQLQESVSGTDVGESQWEVEARLRSEIEIQVRQEFLDLLTAGAGDILDPALRQSLMPPAPSAPRTSNFVDQARQATGLAGLDVPANEAQENSVVAPPLMSVVPASSHPVAKSLSPTEASQPAAEQAAAPVSAFTGDFGEEAAEIFRLEAEEHLQTISMHVAALEKSPTNRDLI